MLKKYKNLALVLLPSVLLLIWCGSIAVQTARGVPVKIKISGYDPQDLLSGHYIRYYHDWDKTDCAQFENSICPRGDFANAGKFYAPENKASALEKEINKAEIVYSYNKKRKPYVIKLIVNGREWKQSE